ncbi:MAG: DUF2946 family protein [Prevotellaceae bacterium]|jgi:hypothetical protein|nr:DUF2946 family protein [Prevotellaceae bacterium]
MKKFSVPYQITAWLLIISIASFYLVKTFHCHDKQDVACSAYCYSASHEKKPQDRKPASNCDICKFLFMPVVAMGVMQPAYIPVFFAKLQAVFQNKLLTSVFLFSNPRAPPAGSCFDSVFCTRTTRIHTIF